MGTCRRAPYAGLLLLASISAGCTSSPGPLSSPHQQRTAKIERILADLQPEMEQAFSEGPPYFLTELRGMHAANQLGAEGKDASILWEQQIKASYRSARPQTEQALRAEISDYSDAMLDEILALTAAEAGDGPPQEPPRSGIVSWDFITTQTAREAHVKATCASLATTPARWAEAYPDRAPFTFERFGIDGKLLESWCG